MTEFIINGRKWWFVKDLPEHQLWTSDYYSSDGDGVQLLIEKNKGGFTLKCFSGIQASEIFIDMIDFGVFNYAPNKIDDLDFRAYENTCCRIADYLCRKFCEYEEIA